MERKTINAGIILGIASLAIILLISLRFDARLAGGLGFKPHTPFTSNETQINRGELITATDSYTIATHDEAILYLDKNTRLKFNDGREGQVSLTLEDGRIFGDGNFSITSRETKITINGRATIVHYPWDNTMAVLLFSGSGSLIHNGEVTTITPGAAMNINTLEANAKPQLVDFSITAPAVVNFYLFVNENDR